MIVLRHDPAVDVATGCEQHAAVVAALLAQTMGRPDLLASLQQAALRLAGFLAAKDSDLPELDAALKTALQAGVALFDLAAAGRCEAMLGDRLVSMNASGPIPGVSADRHRLTVELATVLRDDEALAALAAVPSSALAAGRAADPVAVLRDRAMTAAMRRRPESEAVIDAALRGIDQRRMRPDPVALGLAEADLVALRALVRSDSRELNQALYRALEAHKRQWSTPEAADDPLGFLALGPLGIAAAAHERGMRVEVQSDYAPLRLVLGDLDRDTGGFSADDSTATASGGSKFVLCPLCATPIGRRHRTCPTCKSELGHTELVEIDLGRLATMARVPCRACGEAILGMATICPRCRSWQSDAPGPDEVSLDAFPPEYQLYAVSRPYAPARIALLLPLGAPSPDEIAARLPLSGYSVTRIVLPLTRSAPEATFEIELDAHGPDGPVRARIYGVPLDALPGFDRGALGPSAGAVREALVIAAPIGPELLPGFARLLRLSYAVGPDASGIVDLDTGAARSMAWLRDAASSPVWPDPAALYVVRSVTAADGRAFVHTRGLLRCGVFELEAIDVPAGSQEAATQLIDALGHVLIDGPEALPGEETPIAVGQLTVCWVPSAWVRDRRPDAFGAGGVDRHGFDTLSVAVLAWRDRRSAPLGEIPALESPPVWRLDLERDRAVARATLGRLGALRREHGFSPEVQILVRVAVDDASPTRWCRLVELGDEEVSGLLVGESFGAITRGSLLRVPLDALIDWEVEWPGGRLCALDALAEIASETRRFVDRERSEAAATPVLTSRDDAITATPVPLRVATPRPAPKAAEEPPTVVPRGPRPHPRRAVAALLSLLLPGAGHVVLGDARRGATIFGFGLITLFLFGVVNVVAALECWRAEEP